MVYLVNSAEVLYNEYTLDFPSFTRVTKWYIGLSRFSNQTIVEDHRGCGLAVSTTTLFGEAIICYQIVLHSSKQSFFQSSTTRDEIVAVD